MNQVSQWIWRPAPRPKATTKLFCLPYAGGGASAYRHWGQMMPSHIEVCAVQLPGRESRFGETPLTSVEPMVAAVIDGLGPELDRPYALLGHSMGALVAFEVARGLRRQGGPDPLWLFVSGRGAPHLPLTALTTLMPTLPDDAFAEHLRALGELPPEVTANDELWELLLPTLRADFAICAGYRFAPMEPLTCGISAFASPDDPEATPQEAAMWREHTTGPFRFRQMTGGHMFVTTSRAALAGAVLEDLGLAARAALG